MTRCSSLVTIALTFRSHHRGPKIGQGQFSTVFIGKYFGDLVAIKKQAREQKDLDAYLVRELAVLKNIDHPNLISYIGAWNEIAKTGHLTNYLFIITEFCRVSVLFLVTL